MTAEAPEAMVEVLILNFPIEVFSRTQEHAEGLLREFEIIAQDRGHGRSADALPQRLVSIVEELAGRYAGIASEPEAVRDEAQAHGDEFVDLVYVVPRGIGVATEHLAAVFDEADEFCRAGEHLLSLATPPDCVAFRRWFLDEFSRQAAGLPATPWRPHPIPPGPERAVGLRV